MRQVFGTVLIEPNVLLREGLARILSARPFRMLSSAASIDDSILTRLSQHQSALLVIGTGDDPDATAMQIALFKEKQQGGRVAVLAERYQLSSVLTAFRAGANAYFVKVANTSAFTKSLELVMLGETIMPREIMPFILRDEIDLEDEVDAEALAIVQSNGAHPFQDNGARPFQSNGAHPFQSNGAHPFQSNDARPFQGNGARPLQSNGARAFQSNDARPFSTQERRILCYLVDGFSNKAIARKIDIAEATVKVHVKAILRKIRVHNRTQAAVWAVNNNSFASADGDCSDILLGIADPRGPRDELDSAPLTNVRLLRK